MAWPKRSRCARNRARHSSAGAGPPPAHTAAGSARTAAASSGWPRVHSARSQSDFSARIGVLSKPTQERRRGRLARPAHERVVEPGEDHLGGRGERDDRLDGRVVAGARVQQLLHAVEELGVGEAVERPVAPRRDRGHVAGVGDVAPVRLPHRGQLPHAPSCRRPSSATARRGCSGSRRSRSRWAGRCRTPRTSTPRKSRISAPQRPRRPIRRPSPANSGDSGSGSCSTMLARK